MLSRKKNIIPAANGKIAKKTPARKRNAKEQHFPGQGFFFILWLRESYQMTQEFAITTELCSGLQGLGGGALQQANCAWYNRSIACCDYLLKNPNGFYCLPRPICV